MSDLTKELPKEALYTAVRGYLDDNADNIGVHDNKYTTVIERALSDDVPFGIVYKEHMYMFELDEDGKLNVEKVK